MLSPNSRTQREMLVIKLGCAIFKWQNWIWTKDYLTSSSAFMITSPRQELKEEGLIWFWEDIQNNKIRQIHCREWRGSSWLEIRERGHISIYSLEKLGCVLSVWGQRRFWGRTFMRRWFTGRAMFHGGAKNINSAKHKRKEEEGLV